MLFDRIGQKCVSCDERINTGDSGVFYNHKKDRDRFYSIIENFKERLGYQYLCECDGRMGWPKQGVYFFFEPDEFRIGGDALRVVRVGTHAVSCRSKTKLWNRLSTHRGTVKSGGGNHRGSVFRLQIGRALLSRDDNLTLTPDTWGSGSNAPRSTKDREHPVEIEVSRFIRSMPFIWIRAEDSPGKQSIRAYVESNAIRLLSCISDSGASSDQPSPNWLGHHAQHKTIRTSGLWNVRETGGTYDSAFLDVFETLAERTEPLEK